VRYAFRMTREGPSKTDTKLVASLSDKVNRSGKTNPRGPQGVRTLSDLVAPEIAPLLRARGFANAALHTHWAEIVGARLAPYSIAERLKWPPRPAREDASDLRQPATLMVRIEPAFALELSHQAGLVVERANAFLGWRCIDRLVMSQGPVRNAAPQPSQALRPLTTDEQTLLTKMTDQIMDDDIRKALQRLGEGIIRRAPPT
jgi:hypothetical protein